MKKGGTFSNTPVDQAAIHWMIENGEFTYFLTLTLKKTFDHIHYLDRYTAERVLAHFHDRLARRLFGRRKGIKKFAFVATYELGGKDDRPHFHILFNDVRGLEREEMRSIIEKLLTGEDELRWVFNQRELKAVEDLDGLVAYNVFSGMESIILSRGSLVTEIKSINRTERSDSEYNYI